MFSQILILSLSALSLAGASPAESSSSFPAACGVPGEKCNGQLKTPGLYFITQPEGGELRYLTTEEAIGGPLHTWHPGPTVRHYPLWWVKVVEDQFHLTPFDPSDQSSDILAVAHAPSSTDIPGSNLVYTAVPTTPKTTLVCAWAIESADNYLYTINVPGYDAVWKSNYSMPFPTINLEPADGTSKEHWTFEYYGAQYPTTWP
ncbi:hypothetical protein B0H17DRAFT_1201025 [Mycena rosella]|uniref:Uncharacterized protein n=1 Tax=Mycena rosella TaxID=1033263 RepID=A0AAD7DHE1_MYCRO|nr:hypothetical protein B0H17DRAFT_1201025 [Mycena rosella]